MEAVTDVIFRHVVAKAARPDVFYTEFTNSASYCSEKGEHSTRGRLHFTEDEQPIVAQIWGSKPENFAEMSKGLAKKGYRAIDINMGCPDKAVIKSGGGSDLIRNPELAAEIIAKAKEGGLPISVKTRLGFSRVDEWQDWLTHILRQDVAVLTVHLRTKKEMSKVPAHFELIPEILSLRDQIAPQTLIQINGDILSVEQGLELAQKYPGIDGIMIGRGVFANPFVFEKQTRTHSKSELLDLLRLHLDIFDKYATRFEIRKFEPLKRFFKIYVREFDGASELRARLMETKTTTEVREVLAEFLSEKQV
ncbi:MAG: tRNA-dihydrouridine synthase family protein [bacterium]|nr:tRNA-dihydrouridine synthase family protein [bacterium]